LGVQPVRLKKNTIGFKKLKRMELHKESRKEKERGKEDRK